MLYYPYLTLYWLDLGLRMKKFIITVAFATFFLSGCGRFGFPGVHKIPIEQGNILSSDQIEQLKPGMTKSQVEYVLGTPLIKDSFNTDRWDYQYRLYKEGELADQYKLSVYFMNNKMTSFETNVKNRSADLSKNRQSETLTVKKKPWYQFWK